MPQPWNGECSGLTTSKGHDGLSTDQLGIVDVPSLMPEAPSLVPKVLHSFGVQEGE